MKCPQCQYENPPGQPLCSECSAPLNPGHPNSRHLEERSAKLEQEVENLRRALGEARKQQEATSEILQIISGSPADLQRILDVVAERAARLCDSADAHILRLDGEIHRIAASFGSIPQVEVEEGIPVDRGSVTGRAILDRKPVHIHDLAAEVDGEFPVSKTYQKRFGTRTVLAVPLLREGIPVGTILIRRLEVRPFSDEQVALLKSFADQAAIAIENARLFRGLAEALEQQMATGEILRVISSSPTDIQPVLDAVAASAARVCGATDAVILRVEGDDMRRVAHFGPVPLVLPEVRRITSGSFGGRAILEGRPIHVHDILDVADEFPESVAAHPGSGLRTNLAVPLVREGVAIGAIAIRRTEVRPFTEKQIKLLETFADQAVIAIENVRLFKELEASNRNLTEALEQQTATAEILSVISSSPTDVQPVFDAVAESAARLCEAFDAAVFSRDGDRLRLVAHRGPIPFGPIGEFTLPLVRGTVGGRTVLDARTIHVADVQAEVDEFPEGSEIARQFGDRTVLAVPLMREGVAIGVIGLRRTETRLFTERQVALLQSFADQAVIAIENVRLFKELQEKNRALTEAHAQVTETLEQQTATSEILRVISSSPMDVQPVFDTIVRSAVRLCDGLFGGLYRFDGELIHHVAHHNYTPEALEEVRRIFPARPNRGRGTGRAILERAVVHIPDVKLDPEYQQPAFYRAVGFRSGLWVPMLREGAPIGVIVVARAEPGPFSDNEIALLQTFADQAVIAIENVRLFKELQARNRELMQALDRETAAGEILRTINSSPTSLEPIFDAILANGLRLCEADVGLLFLVEGDVFRLVAERGAPAEFVEPRRAGTRSGPHTGLTRAARERRPVQIEDMMTDRAYTERDPNRLQTVELLGARTGVWVPMLREGAPVGVLVTWRREVRSFTDAQIDVLTTFADQAVIAVENVRLFKELEARTGELTRSVGELKALGEVGQAVSSTLDLQTVLDTIVTRAAQLSGTHGGVIYEYDEATQKFHLRAAHRLEDELVEALRREPLRLGEGATGQAVATRAPFQVTNLLDEKEYTLTRVRSILAQLGYRSILAVPLIFEERILGALVVHRQETGAFAPEVVTLLQTFAAQSALAIQNARLFREIEDKGRQLEAASRHKSEFLANMSHELRTPLNAITGFSEVLLERMFGEINPKQTEYLQDILSSGRHLLSLINDILDLSKIEAGRMELTLAQFHLPLALENALTLVKERATRHGIALDIEVDPGLGEFVGDERKIKQVLLNLLSNAVKFTPEGGRIGVRAARTDGAVEIAVSDTGIGIAPKDQEAIFEEFRQVGSDEARKVEGTGLGLTLTKKFIEMHGGRIWVESEVGKGSTFRFTLPVRPWPTSSS